MRGWSWRAPARSSARTRPCRGPRTATGSSGPPRPTGGPTPPARRSASIWCSRSSASTAWTPRSSATSTSTGRGSGLRSWSAARSTGRSTAARPRSTTRAARPAASPMSTTPSRGRSASALSPRPPARRSTWATPARRRSARWSIWSWSSTGAGPLVGEVDARAELGSGYEDLPRRVPRTDKARELLDWQASTPLRDGLAATITGLAPTRPGWPCPIPAPADSAQTARPWAPDRKAGEMPLRDFALEVYFSRWEFTARYHLTASDAQSMPLADLLELADDEGRAGWEALDLGYSPTYGLPGAARGDRRHLRRTGPAEDILCFAGASGGIYLAMQVLLEPGDHAVVLTPGYQSRRRSRCRAARSPASRSGPRTAGRWTWTRSNARCGRVPGWSRSTSRTTRPARCRTRSPGATGGACAERGVRLFSDEVYRGVELDPSTACRRPPTCLPPRCR